MRVGGCERRRGLTRLDVVILVLIVLTGAGLLFALLPGARESSDRVQCAYNLKQLGAAFIRYNGRHHFLPASRIDDRYATWAVQIGPDLSPRGDNLLRAWDEQKPYAAQTDAARQTQVPQFYCPARRQPPQLSKSGDNGPDGAPLPGALGDYACASGNDAADNTWAGPKANGPIIVGEVRKRDGNLVLEWRGRTRLEDLGDQKGYKILVGDKHVPLGQFGTAEAGDGSLYNGGNPQCSARVAGVGHGLAATPDSPFLLNFGSYHQGGVCQFAAADGALKTFTPDVAEAVLATFADRFAPPEKK
jgi:hypothetical protein